MDIYLIRHGETADSGQPRFSGWRDGPLSAAGERQAEAVAAYLAARGPLPVICSDLLRARATAERIAARGEGPVEVDARWRETHAGELTGRPWSDLVNDLELSRRFAADPLGTVMPGGESATMMARRVHAAFDDLCARHLPRVAVVTHAGPIHAILARCLELPPQRYWVLTFTPGGITHLRRAQGWVNILAVNETGHLREARHA